MIFDADRPIRWGIIGCGNVTEVKSGPALQKAQGSRLVAVMRRDARLAEGYAQRHGVPRWYANAQALIDDPEVDAVYIATPPASHHIYTLAAAAAGKPVYVEKPMALDSQKCAEMIAACQAASVPLFVAYYRRALPRFLKVKSLVEDGAIGPIRFVNILLTHPPDPQVAGLPPDQLPWRLRPEIAGGGLFTDLACHTLDFLDYLLGPVTAVQGFAAHQESPPASAGGSLPAEDIVSAALTFPGDVLATGTWCFNSFEELDQVEITGEKGRLSFSTFGTEPVVLNTAAGSEYFNIQHPPHIQQPLIQQIVDELHGKDRCASRGETALRTTRVMEQILRSYYH